MSEDSVFICMVCSGTSFRSPEELSAHMDSVHGAGGTPFGRKGIPKASSDSILSKLSPTGSDRGKLANIKIIMRKQPNKTETGEVDPKSRCQKFRCSDCGKELSSQHNLERHGLVHTRDKNFVCEFCGLSFKREDNLKDHRCVVNAEGLVARVRRTKNREEVVDARAALVCPACGKSFSNVSNLNKHMKTHDEKREICPECGKQFHLKASLKDHIVQIHEGGRILPCPVCRKELKGRNSLFTHLVRFHPEQKNRRGPPRHACPDCGRVFHQSGNLRKHRLVHSESLGYVCPLCGSAFKFPEQLRRHRLRHDVNNRHPCHMCERSFTMEYELRNHVNIFHGGMSYVCKYCSMSCKHLHAFRRHLKRRHPEEEGEWSEGGLSYLKSCRIANDHFVNVRVDRQDPPPPSNEEEGGARIGPEVPQDRFGPEEGFGPFPDYFGAEGRPGGGDAGSEEAGGPPFDPPAVDPVPPPPICFDENLGADDDDDDDDDEEGLSNLAGFITFSAPCSATSVYMPDLDYIR